MFTTRISNLIWKFLSTLYYRRILGSAGRRTLIRRPLALINPRQIHLGEECFIRDGARLEVVNRPGLPPAILRIGNRVSMEQGVHIVACDRVEIGDDVCFAPRCTVLDSTHPIGNSGSGNRVRALATDRSFTRIGNRVFLGANVVVLPNVTIGENTIVGAGSIVTSDLPANSVCVGSPARVIKYFDDQGRVEQAESAESLESNSGWGRR